MRGNGKVRRLKRLLVTTAGLDVRGAHERASIILLFVGLAVECYVIWQALFGKISEDFRAIPEMQKLLMILVPALLAGMMVHQLLIFRNFMAIERSREEPESRSIVSRWRGRVEILIFVVFGVLTGEVGYILTLAHEAHAFNPVGAALKGFYGTSGYPWGTTLKCLFISFAAFVCILVMIWDALMAAEGRDGKLNLGREELKIFVVMDGISLVYWCLLGGIITPRLRYLMGARFSNGNYFMGVQEPGGVTYLWAALLFFALVYILASLWRLRRAIAVLDDIPEAQTRSAII